MLKHQFQNNTSFTLVELLIVIGILAVLTAAVVIVLNPANLLQEARDAQRIQDISSVDKSITILESLDPDVDLGIASTVYVSIPSDQSNCSDLGLPTISGWNYACVTETNLHNTDGTGWIPINFQDDSGVVQLFSLPIDPTNTTTSGLYYTYIKGSWELTAALESVKYQQQTAANDGGDSATVYERRSRGIQTTTPAILITRGGGEQGSSDITAPVISLVGDASVTVYLNDTYVDDGATALDDTDGDITANIVIVNPVNTAVEDTYTITYNVSDAIGNSAIEVIRTVTVVDPSISDDFESYVAGSYPSDNWQSLTSYNNTTVQSYLGSQVLYRNSYNNVAIHQNTEWVGDDVEVVAKFKAVSANDLGFGVAFRLTGSGSSLRGYVASLFTNGNYMKLDRLTGDGTYTSITNSSYQNTFTQGTWYWIKAKIVGDTVYARYWVDGASEPGGWHIQVTDTRFATGGVGLFYRHPAQSNHYIYVDDFSVQAP